MSERFLQEITVRWADLDPNGHVRHSAYYDYGALCRIAYLDSQGIDRGWFFKHAIGPVLFREECLFKREIHFGDDLVIDFQIGGLSEDGRKWRIRHNIYRNDDELVAVINMDGAWMSLTERKIVVPPEDLAKVFGNLPHTEDFEELKSSNSG